MRKTLIAAVALFVTILPGFSRGSGEPMTWIEGEAVMTRNAAGETEVRVRLENGNEILVRADPREIDSLRIAEREPLRVQGVFVGSTQRVRTEERIFARVMALRGETIALNEPIALQSRDRDQLRLYEGESLKTQDRDQTRDQDRTADRDGDATQEQTQTELKDANSDGSGKAGTGTATGKR